MENNEKFYQTIDEKFNILYKKMNTLQDIVLRMKTEFDLLSKSEIANESITELTFSAENNLNGFIDERPKTCKVLDECTTLIEKGTFRVINIFIKKGSIPAIKLLEKYISLTDNYFESGKCPDSICIKKASKVFEDILNIIKSSDIESQNRTKALFRKLEEISNVEGNEKEESELLSPLSNEIRLKLLKILNRGSTFYTQLEREIGKKGGPFKFHLNKLIGAGYVTKEEESWNWGKDLLSDFLQKNDLDSLHLEEYNQYARHCIESYR